jgi:hypothetical protein
VTKKKPGRKTQLNAELQHEICYLLSQGVPVGATCDMVGIPQATYRAWIAKGEEGRAPYREFVEGTTRARGQARVSLLEKITLSNDWRAHAWLLSHCWPDEFSESRILQPAQPEPSLQINYGPGVQDVLEQGAQIGKQLANLKPGQKIDPRPQAQQNGEQGRKAKAQETIITPAKIHSGASSKRNGKHATQSNQFETDSRHLQSDSLR